MANILQSAMAKVKDLANQYMNKVAKVSPLANIRQPQIQAQKTQQYFNPNSNNGNNFWSSPVAKGLGQVQTSLEASRYNLPKFNFQPYIPQIKTKSNIFNTVANLPANLIGGVAEGLANAPARAWETGARIGYDIPNVARGNVKLTPARIISDIAPGATAAIDVAGLGLGRQIVKEGIKIAGKETFAQAIKKGSGVGAAYGGGRNFFDTLSSKEFADTGNFNPALIPTLEGIGGGAIIGGVLRGSSNAFGQIVNLVKKYKKGISQSGAENIAGEYVRDTAGRFAKQMSGIEPAKPTFYGDLKGRKNMTQVADNKFVPSEYAGLYKNLSKDLGVPENFNIKRIKLGMGVKEITPEGRAKLQSTKGVESVTQGGKVKLRIKPVEEVPQAGAIRKVTLETKPEVQISQELLGKPRGLQVSPESVLAKKAASGIGVSAPSKPLKSSVGTVVKGKSSTSIITEKYAENINLNKLELTPKEKQALTTSIDTLKPQLEIAKGRTLSHKEVLDAAKRSEILTKVTTRDETLAAEASILKARQRMVELDKNITKLAEKGNTTQLRKEMGDLIDSLKVVSSSAADAGRKLESFSITAEDQSVRQLLLKEIGRTEKDTSKIVEEAVKVNWEDANSITAFYRKFVKPSAMEVLDEYRYNNMLSNPRTHIRNAFSNLVQTFVTRPATLAFQGKPGEAAKYYTGAVKSFPEAVDAFVKSFKGTRAIEKPDIAHIGTNKLPKLLTVPTRAMEAGDKFFSALIEGGELTRGATAKEAAKTAEYSLFRQGLFPEGQGKLLNAIDSVTAWTYKAPKAVRWFVPFIRTPMNFAKQWIEYSPTGLATVIGAGNPREQIGKAIVGSVVTAIGAKFALEGNTTWDTPTDPKEKELFYASGRKPFAVKVGDKWVSMMYAGPFAAAFALPAAMKYYQDESRSALTDTQLEKAGKSVVSMAKFLSGQTFMEGIGNFVKFFSGDADYGMGGNLAFTAGQVIPLEGLIRWITTLVDPIYRKGSSFKEGLQKNIPFVSKGLEPYTTPEGEPSRRERVNLVTPYDISTDKPQYGTFLEQRTTKLQQNAVLNKMEKGLDAGKSVSDTSTGTDGFEIEKAKLQLKYNDQNIMRVGNTVLYKPDDWEEGDEIKKIEVEWEPTVPKSTGIEEIDKGRVSTYKSSITARVKEIGILLDEGVISVEEARTQVGELAKLKTALSTGGKAKKLKVKQPKFVPLKFGKAKKITGLTKKKKFKLIRAKKLNKVKL